MVHRTVQNDEGHRQGRGQEAAARLQRENHPQAALTSDLRITGLGWGPGVCVFTSLPGAKVGPCWHKRRPRSLVRIPHRGKVRTQGEREVQGRRKGTTAEV